MLKTRIIQQTLSILPEQKSYFEMPFLQNNPNLQLSDYRLVLITGHPKKYIVDIRMIDFKNGVGKLMQKKQLRMVMIFMAIALLLSALVVPSTQSVQAQKNSNDAKEIMDNLTKEQRAAINELSVEPGFQVQPGINQNNDDPVEVIVEFRQDPAKVEIAKAQANQKRNVSSLADAEKNVEKSHKDFKQAITQMDQKKLGRLANESSKQTEMKITLEYRDAFNGVAMTLPGTAIKDILSTGLVKRVWKNEKIQLIYPTVEEESIKPKMIDSVPQIGVDRLHDKGITGEGIKVGVIDTGIDYNHPDLINVYKGYRETEGENSADLDPDSVMGWDFVDNDADPMETTYKDWMATGAQEFDYNGNSFYTSHGTHVSGTVAAQQENSVDYAVKGVAPGVELYNYRVLGPYGSGDMNWVIGGIDKSVRDGMDVINLSLGANQNDALSPASIAVNNAMLSGVVTVVAAGNNGPSTQTVGAPGASALGISVGASDVSQTIPTFTATAGNLVFEDVQLLAKNFTDKIEELKGQTYQIEYVGIGSVVDYEQKDLNGKIALIQRGVIPFNDKLINAMNAGAAAVIMFNDVAGQIPQYIGEGTSYIPSFRVSKEDGLQLVELTKNNASFTFDELGNTQSEGDYLAAFSSIGPVATSYDIKPDVIAPGVAIFSTYPFFINDPHGKNYDRAYARINGTSMAAPHVAGVAALILQENPGYNPFEVKAALMNTSVDLQESYSVYQVGAGRIDAYEAVYAKTSIKVIDTVDMYENEEWIKINHETGSMRFGSHYLKAGVDVSESKNLEIENSGVNDKTYTIEVDFLHAKNNRQDATANGVELDVPSSVTVPGNESVTWNAEISIPSDAAGGTYEGYLRIVNQEDGEESYQIPFAINYSEKGFGLVEFDRPSVPNRWDYHPFLMPFMGLELMLNSPMESVDLIIKDSETGEALGTVGTFNNLAAEINYYSSDAFMGHMLPFTGDPNKPIGEDLVKLPEGDYIYELLGTDQDGDTFSAEKVVVVDNTPPEMTFLDWEPSIIEVEESMYTEEFGHNALWVHTKVYDSTIDLLNSKGLDFDQSGNFITYYQNNDFPNVLGVGPEGDMTFGVLPEEIEAGPVQLDLVPVDMATSADTRALTRYIFIKKGTSYVEQTYDREKVFLGDSFTMTLNLEQVENLLSGSAEVQFDRELYEFEGVSVNKEFQKYIDENEITINLDEPTIEEGYWNDTVHVGASIEADEYFEGFSGNAEFLDVKFKAISDEYFEGSAAMGIGDLTYKQHGEEELQKMPVLLQKTFELVPKHSVLTGYIYPEAFTQANGFLETNDYEELGVKVFAVSEGGEKYEAESITNYGEYIIRGVPASEKEYTVHVELPGHLNTKTTIHPGFMYNGEFIGEDFWVNATTGLAGDVNNDGVIDINDVMRIVTQYGKDHPNVDINIDGIIDEIDIRYIEKNFLQVGYDAKNKKPKEKLGKRGLNDFLQALGLEPNN